MPKADDIIAEARTWLKTPFRHQASLKGVGCDCVGLIKGVGQATGAIVNVDPRWETYRHYRRTPNPRLMRQGMEDFLMPISREEALPGDVIWMQWRENLPMHLGILGVLGDGRVTLIHAYAHVRMVTEHGFTDEWQARANSYWRYPLLEI